MQQFFVSLWPTCYSTFVRHSAEFCICFCRHISFRLNRHVIYTQYGFKWAKSQAAVGRCKPEQGQEGGGWQVAGCRVQAGSYVLNDILSRSSLALPGKYKSSVSVCHMALCGRILLYTPCSDVHCVDTIYCTRQLLRQLLAFLLFQLTSFARAPSLCLALLLVWFLLELRAIIKLQVYRLHLRLLVSHICFRALAYFHV